MAEPGYCPGSLRPWTSQGREYRWNISTDIVVERVGNRLIARRLEPFREISELE